MKVKISYTIDFDELPEKVQSLLENTLNELTTKTVALQVDVCDLTDAEDKLEMISKLQTFRQSLMKYDMQLADYVNLLANYEKARLNVLTEQESEEVDNGSG